MNRKEQLQRIEQNTDYDVIIIGGGATGLGSAVDSAARGYKTLLLEKYDFAKGTSSRATKLVHGGVRYLAQGNIRLVREALLERGRLLENAPHVCHTVPFVVPAYGVFGKYYYGFGLWFYEFLSGKLSLGKTKLLSKKKTLEHLPDLAQKDLSGGILYYDGQFDDSRLAINLATTAAEQGATVLNYCGVEEFIKVDGKLQGVVAIDSFTHKKYELKAKVIINATGVFSDALLQKAEGHEEATIAPSQGIHLVVDTKFFTGDTSMMIPKTDDGRVLFIIHWHDKLLLGTTDTPIEKVTVEPKPLEEEIEFIITHFNRYTANTINRKDVLSVYVGLRPLAKSGDSKSTKVMPRDHVIKTLPSGLVHVTGGKWTTYRSMAEHAIDKAIKNTTLDFVSTKTKNLAIHGKSNSLTQGHLKIYGSDAEMILTLQKEDSTLREKLHEKYEYTKAEVVFFIQSEMAVTVEDILARRLRLLFLDAAAAKEAAETVSALFVTYGDLSQEDAQKSKEEFIQLAEGYLLH